MSALVRSPRDASPRGSPRNGFVPMPPPAAPGSQQSTPRSSFRPSSAPIRPTSAAVRGGGRLYVQSPLTGMTENEMLNEAKIRLAHNKQRQRLKQLLATSANGGQVVNTKDLLLACRIARLDVGTDKEYEADKFVQPDLIATRDCYGTPRQVKWQGFTKSIQYPELHAAGTFANDALPTTRKQRATMREYQERLNNMTDLNESGASAEEVAKSMTVATDEEVSHYHKLLKRALETRFAEIRRAFRLVDEDNSGECDREEMKTMLNAIFTLNIPEHILDRIIDLADFDGDGQINFAEFARLATEDNVLNMKKTLQADTSSWGTEDAAKKLQELDKAKLASQRRTAAQGGYEDGGYHPKLRKTGPGLDELRRAHKVIKKAVQARYPDVKQAFSTIDKDGSGLLRRAELRRFLAGMSRTVSDRMISGLIDFCDDDGDGKTLSKKEFVKLMTAEYLGAGGFDPNSAKILLKGTQP